MAYEPLSPVKFKELKPQFVGVSDSVVEQYIEFGREFVSEAWPEGVRTMAWAAIVCHLMTLDGHGVSEEAEAIVAGLGDFQSIKTSELTITRYQKAASGSSYQDWLGSTQCGTFYLSMLRMTRRGPRVASGAVGAAVSPYAKDVPIAWPGGASW